MRRFAALCALALLPGCLFTPCDDCPCEGPGCVTYPVYPAKLDHPDSLLRQLQVAYARREIDRYAELLSRDFVFLFQDGDVVPQFGESINFETDSTLTRNMFASPDVRDVRLSMTWQPPSEALWGADTLQRVVLTDLLLDVELVSDVTLRVSNQTQHYYFGLGRPEMGEDPTRYYMRAWRDIGSAAAPGVRTLSDGSAVEGTTWGGIEQRFR